jgi:hypothetical protein
LTVVLRRVVADSRPDEDRPAPAAPPAVRPDLGERRLGWPAVVAAVAVAVVAASGDLQSKVSQVAREADEGNVAAARSHAVKIREKLGKYRDGGMVTAAGYQALVARVDAVISGL